MLVTVIYVPRIRCVHFCDNLLVETIFLLFGVFVYQRIVTCVVHRRSKNMFWCTHTRTSRSFVQISNEKKEYVIIISSDWPVDRWHYKLLLLMAHYIWTIVRTLLPDFVQGPCSNSWYSQASEAFFLHIHILMEILIHSFCHIALANGNDFLCFSR